MPLASTPSSVKSRDFTSRIKVATRREVALALLCSVSLVAVFFRLVDLQVLRPDLPRGSHFTATTVRPAAIKPSVAVNSGGSTDFMGKATRFAGKIIHKLL